MRFEIKFWLRYFRKFYPILFEQFDWISLAIEANYHIVPEQTDIVSKLWVSLNDLEIEHRTNRAVPKLQIACLWTSQELLTSSQIDREKLTTCQHEWTDSKLDRSIGSYFCCHLFTRLTLNVFLIFVEKSRLRSRKRFFKLETTRLMSYKNLVTVFKMEEKLKSHGFHWKLKHMSRRLCKHLTI